MYIYQTHEIYYNNNLIYKMQLESYTQQMKKL